MKTVTDETYNLIINLYGAEHSYISELNRYRNASDYFDGVQFETIVAILNPRTQKWAFENLVEKEKKYTWKYKKTDADGDYHYLSRISGLIELSYSIGPAHLTEKQVIEAGYNPEMFEREGVE